MKKARVILISIVLLSLMSMAFSNEARKFNLFRIYQTTTAVTSRIGTVVVIFTANALDPFCSYTVTSLYTTVPGIGFTSSYRTTMGAVATTFNFGSQTATFYKSCPTVIGWVTTLP